MNVGNHIAKKRFGQNFLVDDFIIHQIVQVINPQATDFIVEIGPGLGALTKPMLDYVNNLHVVELDRDIIKYLKTNFDQQLIVHSGDALKFDFSFNNTPIKVIGNLPYNISTPLLFYLANFNNITEMYFMLQNEVVERLCARPNNKEYGRLSVMMQYKFNCVKLLDIAKECFDPVPKVESAIIKISPKPYDTWKTINYDKLNHIVSNAFNQRRKTIQNSLKNVVTTQIFEQLNIDIKKRAENLTVDEYIQISLHSPLI